MFALFSEVFKKHNLELFIAVPPPLYYGLVLLLIIVLGTLKLTG